MVCGDTLNCTGKVRRIGRTVGRLPWDVLSVQESVSIRGWRRMEH